MRDIIITEIQRIAAANGQAPGQKLFESETGIAAHVWRGKFWARWGDALIDAGYQPNEWQGRLDSDAVLDGVIAAVRYFGRVPTRDEMLIHRREDPNVPTDQAIRRHFGRREDLIAALRKRAGDDTAYADILPMLPTASPPAKPSTVSMKTADGYVYLIKSGDYYKVGRSEELERRIKEIRVALPDKAELVHAIKTDDPPGIEYYWHRRFADKRTNGEWFKLSTFDVSAFMKRKFQ